MIPYLRTILTWLGFLFKTSGSLIRTAVRQCLSLIRKICLGTTRPPLQTFGSSLPASCPTGPWVAPENGNGWSGMAGYNAASVSFPVPTLGNTVQNIPASSAQLQVSVGSAGQSPSPINSRPPSVSPMDWVLKPCAPKCWKRYKGRPLVYVSFSLSSLRSLVSG